MAAALSAVVLCWQSEQQISGRSCFDNMIQDREAEVTKCLPSSASAPLALRAGASWGGLPLDFAQTVEDFGIGYTTLNA